MTTSAESIQAVRRAYAKQILAAAGVTNARLETAFAAVPREDYLGAGPWPILRWGRGYVDSPSADPVFLYTNDLIGVDTERDLNNGQPSFLARLIDAANPAAGEHVVHVGAGVGYYTAIMAILVGAGGRVTAIELDPQLASRAARNLAHLAQVTVIEGDGAAVGFDPADVVLVNAGVTRPADPWLDALRDRGRLILPLSTHRSTAEPDALPMGRRGAVFRIERREREPEPDYLARWLSPVAIFPCASVRDDPDEAALVAALEAGGPERVTRLYRGDALPPEERCWLRAPGWCLASD